MSIHYSEQSTRDIHLGTITNPYDFCEKTHQLRDENGECIYTIEAHCCQCFFWCFCHFGDCCNKVVYNIYENKIVKDEKGNDINVVDRSWDAGKIYKSGEENGRLILADFPKTSNWRDRVMIMATAVELDFLYHGHLEQSHKSKSKKVFSK